jgi:hypothetical protein
MATKYTEEQMQRMIEKANRFTEIFDRSGEEMIIEYWNGEEVITEYCPRYTVDRWSQSQYRIVDNVSQMWCYIQDRGTLIRVTFDNLQEAQAYADILNGEDNGK